MKIATRPSFKDAVIPAYDLGQFFTLLIFLVVCVIALSDNTRLMLYVLAGGYLGACLMNVLLGLYPTRARLPGRHLEAIRQALSSSPGLTQIAGDVWAPRRYKSKIWSASRISLQEDGGEIVLTGRARDLREVQVC